VSSTVQAIRPDLQTTLVGRQCTGGLEHLVGTGADSEVIGEIDPSDGARGIDEEFGGAGDVVAVDAGTFVEHIVAANDFRVGIGEKRIGVAGFMAEIMGLGGRIDADGHRLDTQFLELLQLLLDTP